MPCDAYRAPGVPAGTAGGGAGRTWCVAVLWRKCLEDEASGRLPARKTADAGRRWCQHSKKGRLGGGMGGRYAGGVDTVTRTDRVVMQIHMSGIVVL